MKSTGSPAAIAQSVVNKRTIAGDPRYKAFLRKMNLPE